MWSTQFKKKQLEEFWLNLKRLEQKEQVKKIQEKTRSLDKIERTAK